MTGGATLPHPNKTNHKTSGGSSINTAKETMKKVYNIYDISSGDGIFIQTVTKEISARLVCRQHNRNGERNYMYLQSYE